MNFRSSFTQITRPLETFSTTRARNNPSISEWSLGRCCLVPQRSIGPLFREACDGPGSRLEAWGDWAWILLRLTSHCLLWSQQNGPLGPHLMAWLSLKNQVCHCVCSARNCTGEGAPCCIKHTFRCNYFSFLRLLMPVYQQWYTFFFFFFADDSQEQRQRKP